MITATTPAGPIIDPLTLARGAASQVEAAERALADIAIAALDGEELPPLVVEARTATAHSCAALARLSLALGRQEEQQRPSAPQGCVYLDEWVAAWRAWEKAGGESQPNWREAQPSRVFYERGEYQAPFAPIPLLGIDRTQGHYWFIRLWDEQLAPWYVRCTSEGAHQPEPECWDGSTTFFTQDEALALYADVYGKGV